MHKTKKISALPALIAVLALIVCALVVGVFADGGEAEEAVSRFYGTAWSLLPPVIAIVLALITKEVYSSLFVGILIFLVILGAMVSLMNRAGGSAAFGRWAAKHIKTRVGAQLATIALGVLIFVDDYFNCLTVGSVMRPVTDKHNVSRAKLSYLIDATAAPVCIIAPISSWAAAVASYVEDGPMAKFEKNAQAGDLFSGKNPYGSLEEEESSPNGRVLDLVFPILVLIVCCITGMIYSGGFFDGVGFVEAFSNSDASVGLMLGSAVAFIITLVYFAIRRSMPFSAMMSSIPEGFKAMVPAILILTFAWSLKGMTDSLGAKYFVRDFVYQNASNFQSFLPAIVFIIGCLLAFATGTSWGTFGMLIPIVQNVFPMDNPLAVVCISACMAGAVCGDHCSPISDTTIMASAGAQCDHVNHVSTQLPYAITVAAVSFVSYLIAGFVPKAYISLPIALVLMLLTIFVLHRTLKGKAAA